MYRWLAAVIAEAPAQQGWIFPYWHPHQSPDDTTWPWQEQVQLEIYASQAAILQPALAAPFGLVTHPRALVNASRFPALRARAWTNATEGNATSAEACGFLVLVNTDEDAPSPFQVLLTSAPPLVGNDSVATRLFDASYTKPLAPVPNGSQAGFVLEDWIGPGEVNIYTLGSAACGEAAHAQL